MKKAANLHDESPAPERGKRKASQPIDIAKAKQSAKQKNTTQASGPRKAEPATTVSPEPGSRTTESGTPPASPGEYQFPTFEPKQQRVLELLSFGSTIQAATESVGITRWAFDKWCQRDHLYRAVASRARGMHIADIDDALHELDADARALIHRVVIDENISPGIRVRAALAALTRRGPGWLPRNLPILDPFQPPSNSQPGGYPGNQPASQEDNPSEAATENSPAEAATEDKPAEAGPSQPPETASESGTPKCREHADNADTHPAPAEALKLTANQSFPVNSNDPVRPAATAQTADNTDNPRMRQTVPTNQPSEARPPQPPTSASAPATAGGLQTPEAGSRTTEAGQPAAAGGFPPDPGQPVKVSPPASLDRVFLTQYTVHRHESPRHFDKLFRELVATHQPQTMAEELTVLRITQAFWHIRRIDTMEMAVADSTVAQVRQKACNAHPAAALASAFLTAKPNLQTIFFDRMRSYRRSYEETIDRLENRLIRQQEQRQLQPIREAKLYTLRRKANHPESRVQVRQTRLESIINRCFSENLMPLSWRQ